MTRLNVLLLFVLLLCALSLVTAQQRARKLFIDVEREQHMTQQLTAHWNRLLLEQGALGQQDRIDRRARHSLDMQHTTPAQTLYLPLAAAHVIPLATAHKGSR